MEEARRSRMTEETEQPRQPLEPRIYFAAERTLLAWVRTGLAMMGFGFVVARFGLFLRELAAMPDAPRFHRSGISLWVGVALVILGVVVNIAAAIKHWHTVQRLERGEPLQFKPWSLGMIVAFLMGFIGLLMASYLMFGLAR